MAVLTVFRFIAFLEGISYLLFGFTMPLKYMYDITDPNFYVGMAHGVLFMAYCVFGLTTAIKCNWSFVFRAMAFVASLVPFGTFYLDHKYLKKMGQPAH